MDIHTVAMHAGNNFDKSIHVIKVGGAHLVDQDYVKSLSGLLKKNTKDNVKTILVHGGGKEIEALHQSMNISCNKENSGLRVTSDDSMPLITMTLSGLINKRLVLWLNNLSIRSLGISGVDQCVMKSKFLNYEKLGRVGGAPQINTEVLLNLLNTTDVLVVSPVCTGEDGQPVNVNADTVGQAIAVSVQASELDFITDVDTILAPTGPVMKLVKTDIPAFIESSAVTGGMIPKLQASLSALDGGVDMVRVGSIRSIHAHCATCLMAS